MNTSPWKPGQQLQSHPDLSLTCNILRNGGIFSFLFMNIIFIEILKVWSEYFGTPPNREAICKWDFEAPSGVEERKSLHEFWKGSDSLLNWLPHFTWLLINILPSKPLFNKAHSQEHLGNWCLPITFGLLSARTQTACFKELFTSPSPERLWLGWFPGMELFKVIEKCLLKCWNIKTL